MDQTEGLKLKDSKSVRVITGSHRYGKRARMNYLTVAAVNAGKTVAIYRSDGMISFKPFGDYVEIKFSEHERPW